jgi:hypothetical protein
MLEKVLIKSQQVMYSTEIRAGKTNNKIRHCKTEQLNATALQLLHP